MSMHEEYTKQMTAKLTEWSAQVSELQAKMASATAAQKAQAEAALTKMQQQQKDYQAQLTKVREASEAAFADLKQGAERIAGEYRTAYQQAMSRFAS